jgi:hypothetical protein
MISGVKRLVHIAHEVKDELEGYHAFGIGRQTFELALES